MLMLWGTAIMKKLSGFSALLIGVAFLGDSAQAQTAPEGPDAADPQEIIVTSTGVTGGDLAGGLMVHQTAAKDISTVTSDFIQKQDPATDVFQLIKYLPGANTASADPYNLNAGQITVRGLTANQMGFSLDGSPIQVECCGSVFPGQWLDNENTESVSLVQGSADISSPFTGALGGIVDIRFRDPAKKMGGLIDLSAGSESAKRGFARFDTGYIGQTGIRAFISGSVINADHFRGPGEDNKKVLNTAIVKDFDNGNRMKLSVSYTFLDRDTYKDPTLAQYQIGGAKGAAANWDANFTGSNTGYYKLNANPWNNLIVSAPSNFNLTDKLHYDVTPYFYYGFGRSGGATILNENSIGVGSTVVSADLNANGVIGDANVLTYEPFFERTQRAGVVNTFKYDAGVNQFTAGYWFQYAKDQLYQVLVPVAADGSPFDKFGNNDRVQTANGKTIFNIYEQTTSWTNAIFFGDTLTLGKLSIVAGAKMSWLHRSADNRLPDAGPIIKVNYNRFLPQGSIKYVIDDRSQIFADVATGYRAPSSLGLYPSYSASSGAITAAANPREKPETSFMQEIGYRYQGPIFNGTASAFHYVFKNRQIDTEVCNPSCIGEAINGGSQRGQGVDLEVGVHSIAHFRPYVSAEYLDTKILSDLPDGPDFLATKGKQGISAPHWQAAAAVDYDNGMFFGNVGVKYTARQYATFVNDESIPGFTVVDAAIGVRLKSLAFLKAPELRLNVRNLFNKNYLSGVAGPTTNAQAATGVNGTQIAGSSPTYYVASGRSMLVTLAVGF
jgi:iron complex outermembrane receptor protein